MARTMHNDRVPRVAAPREERWAPNPTRAGCREAPGCAACASGRSSWTWTAASCGSRVPGSSCSSSRSACSRCWPATPGRLSRVRRSSARSGRDGTFVDFEQALNFCIRQIRSGAGRPGHHPALHRDAARGAAIGSSPPSSRSGPLRTGPARRHGPSGRIARGGPTSSLSHARPRRGRSRPARTARPPGRRWVAVWRLPARAGAAARLACAGRRRAGARVPAPDVQPRLRRLRALRARGAGPLHAPRGRAGRLRVRGAPGPPGLAADRRRRPAACRRLAAARSPFLTEDRGRAATAHARSGADAAGRSRTSSDEVRSADWAADGVRLRGGARLTRRRRRGIEYPVGTVLCEAIRPSHVRLSPDATAWRSWSIPCAGDDRGDVVVVDRERPRAPRCRRAGPARRAWPGRPTGDEVWFTAARVGADYALHAVTLDGRLRTVMPALGRLVLHDIAPDGRVLLERNTLRAGDRASGGRTRRERDLSWLDLSRVTQLTPDGRRCCSWRAARAAGPSTAIVPAQDRRRRAGADRPRRPDRRSPRTARWVLAVPVLAPDRLHLLPTGAGETRMHPGPRDRALRVGGLAARRPRDRLHRARAGRGIAHVRPARWPAARRARSRRPASRLPQHDLAGRHALAGPCGERWHASTRSTAAASRSRSPGTEGLSVVGWGADDTLYLRDAERPPARLFRLHLPTGPRALARDRTRRPSRASSASTSRRHARRPRLRVQLRASPVRPVRPDGPQVAGAPPRRTLSSDQRRSARAHDPAVDRRPAGRSQAARRLAAFPRNAGADRRRRSTLPDKPSLLWTFEAGESIESSAAIADGTVFVGVQPGALVALDLASGAVRWKYPLEGGASASRRPPSADGLVFVGDLKGTLHAVDTRTGKAALDLQDRGRDQELAGTGGRPRADRLLRRAPLRAGGGDREARSGRSRRRAPCTRRHPSRTASRTSPAATSSSAASASADGKQVLELASGAYTGASPAIVGRLGLLRHVRQRGAGRGPEPAAYRWRYQDPSGSSRSMRPRRWRTAASSWAGGTSGCTPRRADGQGPWTFATQARIDSSPAVVGGRVFAGRTTATCTRSTSRTARASGRSRRAARFGLACDRRRPPGDRLPGRAHLLSGIAGAAASRDIFFGRLASVCRTIGRSLGRGRPQAEITHEASLDSRHPHFRRRRTRGTPREPVRAGPRTGRAGAAPGATRCRPRPPCSRPGSRAARRWRGRRAASAAASRASPSPAAASTRWATRTAQQVVALDAPGRQDPVDRPHRPGLGGRVRRAARHADRGRRPRLRASAPRATSSAWTRRPARSSGGRTWPSDFGGQMMSHLEVQRVAARRRRPPDRHARRPRRDAGRPRQEDRKEIWRVPRSPDLGDKGKDGAGYSSVVISQRRRRQAVRAAHGPRAGRRARGRRQVSSGATTRSPTTWRTSRRRSSRATTSSRPPATRRAACCSSSQAAAGGVDGEGGLLPATPRRFQNHHGGLVLVGDHIYGGHGHNRGFPICIEMATGKVAWGGDTRNARHRLRRGHLRRRPPLLPLPERPHGADRGDAERLRARRARSRSRTSRSPSWPHPVVAGGRLYLREQDNLYVYDVKA